MYLPTFDKINALFASPTHDVSRAKTALALSGAATKHHLSTSAVIGETEKKGIKAHDPIKSKGKRRARSVDGDSEAFEATPVPAAKKRKIKTEEDNDDGAVAAGSSASSTSDASKVNGKCRMSSCCSRFLCRMTVSRLSRPRAKGSGPAWTDDVWHEIIAALETQRVQGLTKTVSACKAMLGKLKSGLLNLRTLVGASSTFAWTDLGEVGATNSEWAAAVASAEVSKACANKT